MYRSFEANPTAVNSIGNTAFILACDNPHAFMVAIKMIDLYGEQTNPHAVNKADRTALDLAVCNFSPFVYDTILKYVDL